MARRRLIIHTAFLFLMPLVVAWFGLGPGTAAVLVIVMLLWRWLVVLSGIVAPEKGPGLVLESISISHFVEKVRWCMDRLGIEYAERPHGGLLGIYFTGRTVPQLQVRTGIVRSVIGNSPEILRFLWGTCAAERGDRAAFLAPTTERLRFEQRLDRYGRNQQVWLYHHLLDHRALTLKLWGADDPRTPGWQRVAVKVLFPVLRALIRRSLRIDATHYNRVAKHIEELLEDVDTRLADGRQSILGGDAINYTDLAFAALSGPWLTPPGYGAGKADACLVGSDSAPEAMRADIDRWTEDYPRAVAFVIRLYADERTPDA